MRSSNDPSEPWPWEHPRTRARAKPWSCSILWSGFTGLRRIFRDPRQHTRRSYGAYCNRARIAAAAKQGESDGAAQAPSTAEDSDFARETRRTWARILRKIFEAEPLVCSCGARMRIVSFVTNPRVVDRILRHRESDRCQAKDPFEPRAPPRAYTRSRQ